MNPQDRLKDQIAAAVKANNASASLRRPTNHPGGPNGGLTGADGHYTDPARFTPPTQFHFSELMPQVWKLHTAIDAAINADVRDFQILTAASGIITPIAPLLLQGLRQSFNGLVRETQGKQREFEAEIRKLQELAPLPPRLMGQAEQWDRLASKLIARANEVKQWQTVPGWSGASAEEYGAAARVQANAIAELAGIMSSIAKSTSSAAALNMAAFSNIARAAALCNQTVQIAPPLSKSFQFARTRTAKRAAEALIEKMRNLVLLNQGRAAGLAGQISTTFTAPALLNQGSWPTGTAAASVAPVDTSTSVRPAQFYGYITR